LVYCFRGGKRSQLWLTILESVGYRVEKMDGGWKNYRRWVNEQLSTVPPQYHYKILCGPTGCGKTRLLYALQAAGAQVLDLEELANHRGSVLGEVPGEKQPTQKYFDSLLLNKLSAFDPKKPIWVEAESKKIGNVQLPDALLETMRNNQTSQTIMIETALEQRVQLSREDYPHFEEDHVLMFKRLAFLKPLVGNKEFAAWEALAEQNAIPTLLEQLMHNHYDPTYRKSILRNYPKIDASPSIALSDLSPAGLLTVAKNMCAKFS
ncbi:MAG: tRNA 2-selenouridine(34) synthase MnmH, partial [Glaciimonas sp.]|nr:tRNA 2-selenouridine(34) synthase MnmH [Glaciimonas sp.]